MIATVEQEVSNKYDIDTAAINHTFGLTTKPATTAATAKTSAMLEVMIPPGVL